MTGKGRKPPQPRHAPLAAALPQAELARLFALFNAGRHAEMEAAALALVERHAADGQAWKALGIAQLVQRKDAQAALERAMALLPGDAEVPSNLGGVFTAQGRLDEAEACYRRALALQPAMAQAHSNLGDVLGRQGRWSEAETSCREALRLQPALAAARVNLGNAQRGLGRLADAAQSYRQAVAAQPALAEAQRNLGLALQQLGDLPGAAAAWQQRVRLRPGEAASHFQLGNVLLDLARPADAVAQFGQALALQPGLDEARANLGVALGALGRHDEAVLALQAVLQRRPDDALAHSNLGNALLAAGRLLEALACQQRAAALAPALALVHGNLGHALKTIGQPGAALLALRQALALEPERLSRRSECLFVQQYLMPATVGAADPGAGSASERLAEARAFGAAAQRQARPGPARRHAREPDKCLRIGLLSPDLRQHPVGYFSESVLAALHRHHGQSLTLHAYANQRSDDALSRRLRGHCRSWLAVADLDDAALAARIRDDGIDILLDLAGHTVGNRLPVLAWRPAPVQAGWLGYCASTGLAEVDAFIADPWIAPPGAEAQFVEPLQRLPETFLCFTPPDEAPPVAPLPAASAAALRFGCFNHLAKIGDAVLLLWSRILQAVPGSVLVLQCAPLQDPGVCQQWRSRLAAQGIAADRLHLQAAMARPDYLAALGQVDIVLDPFPYPGGTTSLEALWMGVPVLTLPGASALSRQGLSILQNLGLADWVAADADDYLARAVRHAADRPALERLRRGLRERLLASPLCDAPRFARHFDAALRALWRQACARAPADA